MPSWIILALTTAIITSINNVVLKHLVNRKTHYTVVALGMTLAIIPFLSFALVWYWPTQVDSVFWVNLVIDAVVNILAFYFAFRTLVMEDASFLAPIAAFNPLMTTVVSMVTLKEIPSAPGVVGIISVCIGASLLGKERTEKLYVSFLKFFRRKSVQYMLGAYLIWAITPTFEKTALLHSHPANPALLSLGANIVISVGFLLIAFRATPHVGKQLVKIVPVMLVVGLLGMIGQLAAFTAFTLTNVGYASAIFRTSILFTTILASLFLKEKVEERVAATLFMFLGVILLAL